MFSGYKTYIAAFVGVVAALGAYLSGDVNLVDTAKIVLDAVLAVFIRLGIAKV